MTELDMIKCSHTKKKERLFAYSKMILLHTMITCLIGPGMIKKNINPTMAYNKRYFPLSFLLRGLYAVNRIACMNISIILSSIVEKKKKDCLHFVLMIFGLILLSLL
ncbi:hypothetical protein BD560DRAFT_383287 [Blakeslea trispora]|nr:hypothetical protein BD560DRAFT_383287 [Blakeslea trispora]